MNLDAIIQNLLNAEDGGSSIEKSAEDRLLDQLRGHGQTDSSYADLSDEELFALAAEVLTGDGSESYDEESEKLAEDDQRGKIMAHAFTHELGLAKLAMLNGVCRVCKTNPFDIEGSSICSSCLS